MVGEFFHKISSAVTGQNSGARTHRPPAALVLGQKVGYLSALEVFRDLNMEEMDWLDRVTTSITCEKGRVIYRPGESGEVLYLLKNGAVELYRLSSEGKKLVLTRLTEHTFFGEMSILGQGMYDSFAEAVEPSVLCAMSRSDVEALLLTKPVVGLRLLQALSRRLLDVEATLEDMAFRSVIARMASLLLRLMRQQDSATISGLTHQELAELAGTFRETATQALNQLRADGLIEIGRARISIRDVEGLTRVAQA